jgi:hypothetical protein
MDWRIPPAELDRLARNDFVNLAYGVNSNPSLRGVGDMRKNE